MRTLVALLVVLAAPALAQSAEGWEAYPAYTEVAALAAAPDGVWAAANGGVFFYDVGSGELVTVTAADGLQGGSVGALAFDEDRGALWVGYRDGVLERLDAETLEPEAFFDIRRADQYPARGVRRIVVAGDVLYVATDFGVVVFDAEAERVRSSYARFGGLPAGTPVNDVLEAPLPDGGAGLWVASEGGLYYAARDADNLQIPGAWTRDDGLDGAAFSLALFEGGLYVAGGPDDARDLYQRRPGGGYDRRLFINNRIIELIPTPGQLFGVSRGFAYSVPPPGQPSTAYRVAGGNALSSLAVGPDGTPWVGDAAVGLVPLPVQAAPGIVDVESDAVAPPGPLSTRVTDVDVGDDGILWLVTERLENAGYAAISRFEGGAWTSFRTNASDVDVPRASFLSAKVGPDGVFYAGSAGDGVGVFRDGDVATYGEDDSSLRAAFGAPGFVVVRDAAFEDDLAWVLNFSALPLHVFDGETWAGLPYPPGVSAPATTEPFRIAIDDLGQKWLALGAAGLAVWDTGAEPASAADDRLVLFRRAAGAGADRLGSDVRDVVFDGERIWIGTDRGVASVFSPGSAFGGDPTLASPQVPITDDGLDFLLLDVEVLDLEVDPAGQVWVGTTSGAYLINADGDGLVRTVTAETSPLPSDLVSRVAVDPTTGRVYFVTDGGLFSAPGDATRPTPGADGLTATPSPYRPAVDAGGVVVRGLTSSVSDVRVMTVAGDVVYAAEVRGGSFRWDGRDRDGRPVPSGVYLVAASGSDGATRTGKVAVIR